MKNDVFDSEAIHKNEFIKVFIDNKECYAYKGESLLNVARRHNINIPTLCDLKKLTPTGACRMCVVEEDNGNIIASCKSYVDKEARIYTNTKKIQKYRNQIMSFLCINHPLECGVCDKSGECELQDKVLESKVAIQPFFAVQKQNDFVHFHNKVYNESLCIMCERCARTCNEFVGNNVLSVIAGGFHSKIGVNFNAYCEDCDECVSVCPTGAMFSSRFTYTSNAWELEKISSHCPHCSLNCPMHYEVKHNIDSKKEVYRIKNEAHIGQLCHAGRHNFLRRLEGVGSKLDSKNMDCFANARNDEFNGTTTQLSDNQASLRGKAEAIHIESTTQIDSANKQTNSSNCSMALNAFTGKEGRSYLSDNDYPSFSVNHSECIDKDEFIKEVFNKVDSIRLGNNVTNEEAYLANLLAQKTNKKLYCNEALRYKEFTSIINHFGKLSRLNLTGASRERVHVVLGGYLYDEMPILRSDLSKYALKNGAKNIWISPISEDRFDSDLSITYEVGAELALVTLLLSVFSSRFESIQANSTQASLLQQTLAFLEAQDLAYLMAESNISEYELERLGELCLYNKELDFGLRESAKVKILVTQDFYLSTHYREIAQILSLLSLVGCEIIPLSYNNIAGIATLCELSPDDYSSNALGIRAQGVRSIAPDSAFMRIPPMQFMEGSVIDVYGNLTKFSPSYVDSDLQDLLDIFGEYLGLDYEYIVDITSDLPFMVCDLNEVGGIVSQERCFAHAQHDNTACHSEGCKPEESKSMESTLDSNMDCFGVKPRNDKSHIEHGNGYTKGDKSHAGQQNIDFDSLPPKTKLKPCSTQEQKEIIPYNEIELGEGSGAYIYNAALSGNLSFYRSEYRNEALLHNNEKLHGILKVSKQFCLAKKLQDNEIITLQVGVSTLQVRVVLTPFMKGMVAVLASAYILDSEKYFDYKKA